MIKIGVTGGIGSGKTTVCRIFEMLGVPVYNSDIEARRITDNDPEVIGRITTLFGTQAYFAGNSDGGCGTALDRKCISAKVFNDPTLLNALNNIVHPAVEKDFEIWAQRQEAHYVIQEAAILFESGAYKKLDKMVVVSAPEELRISRVIARDNMDEATVRARMANQLSEEERISRADYVIVADDRSLIIPQVLELHEIFLKL